MRLADTHYSVALHPGGCVDRVSEQTVARHLQPHHAGHHHARVDPWGGGGGEPYEGLLVVLLTLTLTLSSEGGCGLPTEPTPPH